jgi:peptide/nickel transport system substrate-binding protein
MDDMNCRHRIKDRVVGLGSTSGWHRSARATCEASPESPIAARAVASAQKRVRMMRSRGDRRIGLLSLIVSTEMACAVTPPARGHEDRPIEMLVANDPETLDPRYATDSVGVRTTRLIHAGLVRLDPETLAARPYLATSWQWLDPLTLRVVLRDDVYFHSGAPMRAHDVAATLRAIGSPRVASRQARIVEAIADVREAGEHAIVVRLARPHATLLTDLELPILRADEAASPPAPGGSLDGLGPFAVRSFTQGEVQLVPASGGALPRPLHAITLRTVHDENTRALRLEVGRADIALNLLSPALLPALSEEPGLTVTARPGANLTYVVVQEARPYLGDPRVRRAMSLAIDRSMLVTTVFDRRATAAGGLIAPTHWAHTDRAALAFDPARARALLAEADAAKVRVTLLTSTERLRGDVARVIAQELGDVGIDVTVVPLELGTMIARLSGGDFDLAILQLPEMTEPNVLRHFLHSGFVPPVGANRGRVFDATLDTLLDEGDRGEEGATEDQTTFNATAAISSRKVLYARVEDRVLEKMHVLPLWYEDQVAVTSARARHFRPSAEGRWLGLAGLN